MTKKNQKSKEEVAKEALKALPTEDVIGNKQAEIIGEMFRKIPRKRAQKLVGDVFYAEFEPWESIADRVWESAEERLANKYHFLQGDVIHTSDIAFPGKSPFTQTHSTWIVRSPTCDAIREDYVHLAPVFLVQDSFQTGSEEEKMHFSNYRISLGLISNNLFPIVVNPLKEIAPEGEVDQGGPLESAMTFYADLRYPAYILKGKKESAIVRCSMTFHGWQLWNMILQQKDSRATVPDERKLRQILI